MAATKENTKFLYTYFGNDAEPATFQFRRSGYWADAPVMCAGLESQTTYTQPASLDFVATRIIPTLKMCQHLKNKGIEYIFYLDSTDTLFVKRQEAIFEAFNRRYKPGSVLTTALFSKPALKGHVHCTILDNYVHHWYNRNGYKFVMCIGIAGQIDVIMWLLETAIWYSGQPMPAELQTCTECKIRTKDDLMLLYRIHKDNPALFDCDTNQEVFSYYYCMENTDTMTAAKLKDDSKHPDNTIGEAGIIHASCHFHYQQPLAALWKTLPEVEKWNH